MRLQAARRLRGSAAPPGVARFGPAVTTALMVTLSASCAPETAGRHLPVADGHPERGRALVLAYGCDPCHVIPGVREATGLVGPPLIAWSERSWIAGSVPNTPEDLVRWIMDPQAIEPGTAMPSLGVSEPDARDIAAYLFMLGTAEPVGRQPRHPRALLRWFGLRPGGDPEPRAVDVEEAAGTPWGAPPRVDPEALPGDPERGKAALRRYGCTSCHSTPGVRPANAAVGPPLDMWSRRGFIAGALINTPDNLVHWIMRPQSVDPGTAMPDVGVTEEDAQHIAAYLFRLR